MTRADIIFIRAAVLGVLLTPVDVTIADSVRWRHHVVGDQHWDVFHASVTVQLFEMAVAMQQDLCLAIGSRRETVVVVGGTRTTDGIGPTSAVPSPVDEETVQSRRSSRRSPTHTDVPITEPGQTSRQRRFLKLLTNYGTVLFELFGEYGVQERIRATVQWEYKDRKHFGVVERYQMVPESSGEGEERDGSPAGEVGEDEQSHPLGDPGVVGVPRLGTADRTVHLCVAGNDDTERNAIQRQDEADVT